MFCVLFWLFLAASSSFMSDPNFPKEILQEIRFVFESQLKDEQVHTQSCSDDVILKPS